MSTDLKTNFDATEGCAAMPGYVPDDVVKAAYIELMEGPIPQTRTDFRRAVMLAVIIGRELEDRSHSASVMARPAGGPNT